MIYDAMIEELPHHLIHEGALRMRKIAELEDDSVSIRCELNMKRVNIGGSS